jgi:hypothetical protein
MMKDRVRFIDAELCPIKTNVGWMVARPPVDYYPPIPELTVQEVTAYLHQIGLDDMQFTVYGHGWGTRDARPLKRVVFRDHQAYLMALMGLM